MPLHYYWESEGFVFEGSGSVTAQEVFEANEAFLDFPKGVVPKYQLLNALEVDDISGINEVDMLDFSADDLAVSKELPDMKIAFVCEEGPIMEKLIKFLRISWSLNTSWELRIFNSLKAAGEWLGLSEN